MLSLFSASSGFTARAGPIMMGAGATRDAATAASIQAAKDGVWDIEAKTVIYDAWDPESPRDYDNFNPFERNDEGSMCDMNGCFPGQSRGYKSPLRPDQSWEIMQKKRAAMDALKEEAKFNFKGSPGTSPSTGRRTSAPRRKQPPTNVS